MAKKSSTEKALMVISCPNCGKNVTLDEALTANIESKFKLKFESELSETESKYKKELKEKDKLLKLTQEKAEEELEKALKVERLKLEKEAKKRAEESISKELKDLKEQLQEKSEKLEKADENELKFRKEKRELEEAQRKFQLEMERKLDEERKKIIEGAVKRAEENHELKDKEKQKIIDDLKNQIQELQKKSEQGSQKLQGEVLEEELERVLGDNFRTDEIKPISSGVAGADVLQKVHTSGGISCGSILFESKNAKNWSNGWISKLKKDMLEEKADIGVLVTTVLPEGIDAFGIIDKIFVVHYRLVIPVATMLRNQLLEISLTKSFNVGKNEKMEALYNYLTSTEFRQRIESIGGAFKDMMDDLQREKRAMIKQWSKREKQIEQVFNGLGSMYGSMQGLVGSSLQNIKLLEMQESSEDGTGSQEDILAEDELFKKRRRK